MDDSQTTATATIQIDNDLTRVTEWRFPPGASYTRPIGSTHNVVNESDQQCAFVEIEFKQQS